MDNIEKLRFWCQKVIPLVYDDSLSYMELLSKVIKKLNEIATDFNFLNEWKEAHEEEYEELANTVEGLVNSLTEIIVPWDSSVAYKIFTIVEYQGTNYIALQDVPIGVMITNTEYWTPANTVLEQLNAIGVLVSRMEENWNVVPEFDDLKNTTTDSVIVLNDDSYYGSGKTVRFIKADHPLPQNPELLRVNGDYMMPEPLYSPVNTYVPANALGEVIGSYLNKPNIADDGTSTPFHMDVENPSGLDCSSFATLITRGISYDNSRFVIDRNIDGQYAGGNLPRNPESTRVANKMCYNCGEMGLFYAEQNRLFWVDYNLEHPVAQLQTGDLLFESDIAIQPNRYLYLEHVQVVLSVYPDRDIVLVAHTGGGIYNQPVASNTYNRCRLSLKKITGSDEDKIKTRVFARPSYSFAESPAKSVLAMFGRTTVNTPAESGSAVLSRLYFKKMLDANKIYTVVVEGDLPDYIHDGASLALRTSFRDGSTQFINFIALQISDGNKAVFMFVPPANAENISVMNLMLYVGADDVVETQKACVVNAIDVLEGIQPDAVPTLRQYEALSEVGASFGTVYTNRAITLADKTVVDISLALTSSPASDGMISLGTLNPNIIPISNNARYAWCYKGGEIRGVRIAQSNNEVTVYAKAGETGTFSIHTSIDS